MDDKTISKTFKLKPEHELRMEAAEGKQAKFTLKVVSGQAEIFGVELADRKTYTFKHPANIAVFTWHGCEVQVDGHVESHYVAEETPMRTYININAELDKLRSNAAPGDGPKCMIAGPVDVGKSTLTRMLLNYAVRGGWQPAYVDLDLGQNDITIPGSVAATPIEHPIHFQKDDNTAVNAPICYFHGHTSPSRMTELFKERVEQLAKVVNERAHKHEKAGRSGAIINTCGWIEKLGYELLLHHALAFKVTVIVVLGNEKLYSQLKEEVCLQEQGILVTTAPKSGGVAVRSKQERAMRRNRVIAEYFYGPSRNLHPHYKHMRFDQLEIYRAGGGPQAPSHTLPIGAKPLVDPNALVLLDPAKDYAQIKHHILSVFHTNDKDEVKHANSAGFVFVTDVNVGKRLIVLLSPAPGPLPSKIALVGSLKWEDKGYN